MPATSPRLNPQPEPPIFAMVTDDTMQVQSGTGVLKIHWKTGQVEYVPEMPILESAAKTLTDAAAAWQDTRNVKGLEKVHTEAAAVLASLGEALYREARK